MKQPDWEAFGRAVLEKAYDVGGGDIDGGDLQGMGVEHRVLVETVMQEPCGEWCICAESAEFPTTCYRIAEPVEPPAPPKVACFVGVDDSGAVWLTTADHTARHVAVNIVGMGIPARLRIHALMLGEEVSGG